jgi:diguanylate cyclase (GGDEF)-like protein
MTLHPRLRKQLGARRVESLPDEWRAFVRDVDARYRQADADREQLEQSVRALHLLLHRAQEEEGSARARRDRRREEAARTALLVREARQQSGIASLETGADLVVRSANAAASRLCGAEQMEGKPVFTLLLPLEPDALTLSWNARLARGEPILQSLSCRTAQHRVLSCDWVCIPKLSRSGKLDSVAIFWRDDSTRSNAQAELAALEERASLALAGAGDALFDWDLVRDKLVLWPDGLGLAELPAGWSSRPLDWFDRVHPDDVVGLRAAISAHLQGQIARLDHDHRVRPGRGDWRWVSLRGEAVRNERNEPVRLAGLLSDITRHRAHAERMAHDARHDPLTGLPNRTLFLDLLRHSFNRIRRHGDYRFAVLFIDIDHFKRINDSFGHEAGDQLLTQIARRLESSLRQGDTLARHAGDEFTMWLDDVRGQDDAIRVADRVHEMMRAPLQIDGRSIQSSVSIGIAIGSSRYPRVEDVLRDADVAMYRAKAQGRARTALFEHETPESGLKVRPLETDLRNAILLNQLRIHYLPIVDVASGEVKGVEALARWQHPRLGLVAPERFLALAVDTGLIVEIDRWVMRTASFDLRDWRRQTHLAHLTLSVNLSDTILEHQDLPAHIDAVLRESALSPRDLILDITEGAMAPGSAPALTLASLHRRGVGLHVDDFGMASSWLRHLHSTEVDSIKIDRSFLAGNARADRQVMTRIVSMARDLGKRVIAEGVETDEQFQFLKQVGCDSAQGYLFSNPIDAEGTSTFLARGPRTDFS